ncbi:unnamed protein product [Brassicogethes aeneus]|uniref:G kinase-anchoring protein 1 n=1 Tax=Brassicogethes aeneus TaxID=1431903 RepID=A0A9P0B251_BRAAE|nr:unnamed protein product [Brassicogethes aeneus]
MDISVPSRFSCLKIEDEDFKPVSGRKKSDKKPVNSTSAAKKTTHKTTQSKKKNKTKDTKQWEEWKQKDNEIVNDHYEQDLQHAILQSKLAFEKEKKHPAVLQISDQPQKKKKNKTMSLDQFLEKPKVEIESEEGNKEDPNFFDNIKESVKSEITKESVKAKRKEREINIDEVISIAQMQEKLEKEKANNAILTKELNEAKIEIASVKKRNSTLCSMLSQGEMKDKAAVLLELEKLTLVKEELTEEVSRLYKLLEQERSKSGNNQENHKNKDKVQKKKKN